MKKEKKLIYSFILLSTFLLVSCASITNKSDPTVLQSKELIIGFSQSGIESRWRDRHTESILTELKKKHYQLIYKNGYMDQNKQIEDIRNFIANKVDIIILAPLVEHGWEEILSEVKAANIPLIIVDRNINNVSYDDYLTQIGPNFKAEGIKAAIYLQNKMKQMDASTLNVLELAGLDDSSPGLARSQGFSETINQETNITIVDTLHADFMQEKAYQVMNQYLNKAEKLPFNILYSHNDDMTLGAIKSLRKHGYQPGKDIIIISTDGQKEVIDLLKKGEVNCVVECNPNVGWYVGNTIERFLGGHNIAKEIIIPETIFSDLNDIKNIPPRNY